MKKNKFMVKDVLLIVWLAVCLLLICLCFHGAILGSKFMAEKQASVIWIIIAEFFFLVVGFFSNFSFLKICRYLSRNNKYGLSG